MSKPRFSLCEKLATQLLAHQNLFSTRIDVQYLRYDKTIVFDSIQNYASVTNTPIEVFINPETQLLSEGCCIPIYDEDIYVVLYNDKIQSEEHLNWTLAHEIGHIYLGHKKDSEIEEIEAHFFAAQLLMPEYVLHMINRKYVLNVDDICNLFNVSMIAAQKRIKTFNKKKFITVNSFDRDIWEMMKSSIESYYFRNNLSEDLKRFLSMPMIDI